MDQSNKLHRWGFLLFLFVTLLIVVAMLSNDTFADGVVKAVTPKPAVAKRTVRSNIPMQTPCYPYRAMLVKQAQFIYGINAPVPMFAAQLEQESGCKPNVTAWDGGQGLAQFMPTTGSQISKLYPDIGPPDPMNPTWAISAQVRYVYWLSKRVKGKNACELAGATDKSYNAGLGYTQWAEAKSPDPTTWFLKTEDINVRQSQKNFVYSRAYPRWILFKRQEKYADWGMPTCIPEYNPPDNSPVK